MRWFKKIVRAVLALLPAFILSLSITNPSYATRHDYDGLMTDSQLVVPSPQFDSSTNKYVMPSSFSSYLNFNNQLLLHFDKSVYDFDSFNPYKNNLYINTTGRLGGYFLSDFSSNCIYNDDTLISSIHSYLQYPNTAVLSVATGSTLPSTYTFSPSNASDICISYDYQTTHPVILDSSISSLRFVSPTLGTLDNQPLSLFNDLNGHSTTSTGILLHKTETSSSDGFTYSHSFSFSRLFDGDQPNKFNLMRIPLSTTDDYFITPSNFYSGRQLQFKFLFKFDGSFNWAPDLSQGQLGLYVTVQSPSDSSYSGLFYDCPANLVQVSGHTHLEITCDITLDKDYLYFIPYLYIRNDPYVWDSNSWWEFYSFYLVTDGDDTPGDRFNSDIIDNMWSPTDGVGGDGSCSDLDLACKLNNLFIFSIPVANTPLGGILGNFSDQSSCSSIPTIAGMIHSNETQICPWFSSNVRSISTPVLSLFSVCLVFGFIVRWLKSSSGDNMLNSHKNGDKD